MRRYPSISSSSRVVSRTISSGWIRSRLEQLDGLLGEDALRARLEILKQLDGDLTIRPLPSEAGAAGHAFEIAGRIERDGLLAMNPRRPGAPRWLRGPNITCRQTGRSSSGSR
jgi:hypothetical protein